MNKYSAINLETHKVSVMDKSGKPGEVTQFRDGSRYRLHATGAVTNANPKPWRSKKERKTMKRACVTERKADAIIATLKPFEV